MHPGRPSSRQCTHCGPHSSHMGVNLAPKVPNNFTIHRTGCTQGQPAAAMAPRTTPTALPPTPANTRPNARASQGDARSDEGNPSDRRCGLGIQIFGLTLSAFGPPCPTERIFYPAHQICRGEPAPDCRCEFEKNLPVEYESCDCVTATLLGIGLALPACTCKAAGILGEIEDFATRTCPDPYPTQ